MIGALALLLQISAADPAVVQRARPAPAQITFHALVVPETVTVGQQALYQVAVFVPEEVRQRLRRNPEFVAPELRAMLAYDLSRGYVLLTARTIGRTTYEIHVFQRAIFPITAGVHPIAPAELSYALPLGSSFFSREEPHTLRSDPVTLVALEPPAARRPAGWNGAVGAFTITTRVDSRTPHEHDVVVVTARVVGTGNINLLPRPALTVSWGTVTASSERVQVDSTALTVAGAKEFDWLVTPRDTGEMVLPPIRYSAFDPVTQQFVTTESAPETLSVTSGVAAGTGGPIVGRTLPGLRESWHGERGPWLLQRSWFLLALALMPMPALLLLAARTRARRRPSLDAGARLRSGTLAPDEARRAFRRAIEERLGLDALAIPRGDDVASLLRRQGVSAPTAADIARRLAALDRSAFDKGGTDRAATSELAGLYDALDREALPRRGRSSAVTRSLAWAIALGASASLALAADGAEAGLAFSRGLDSWRAQRVDSASVAFAEAARLAPRASDAWANLGEARWAARDTAAAALAWQRALRLQPTARDLRDRLSLLGVNSDGWIAGVVPIDADHAALVLVATWALGWGLLALAVPRVRPRARTSGLCLLLLAGVAAAIGVEGARRQVAHDLVVVRGGESLRGLAALAAEASAPVAGGEVARVVERGPVWSRVQLDGDRAGWIISERLLPLGTD